MKNLLHLIFTASVFAAASCSSAKLEEDPTEPEAPIDKPEDLKEILPNLLEKEEELPPPFVPKSSKKTPLFVDPQTHNELMREEDKKTVFGLPDNPDELPKPPAESAVSATPPIPTPPPINAKVN